ncbi:MAG: MFS transporter [Pseudonocardia sp.]|nr:MFS transporter [Pseudonocardia sp.]
MHTIAAPERLLRGPLRTLTVGSVALVSLAAFEAVAVATAMPTVAVALDGLSAYGLAFGLPLATSVLGMVVAGTWSDARGPAWAMRVGVGLFVVALLVAGSAPSMPVFAIGRAVQGLGSGMFSVALYVVVGHVVPQAQRPKIFAAFAAAWVLPAVVGPLVAGLLVERVGWRWVFLVAAVLAVPAALLVEPALRGLARRAPAAGIGQVPWAVGAALGATGLHQAGQLPPVPGLLLGVAATVAVLVSVARLLPRGTLRGRPGMPAVIALRGLIAAAFFAGEAFLPLLLSRERGLSPTAAGLVITVAALSWATGSWIQGRRRAPSPTLRLRLGTASIASGVLAASAVVIPAVPVVVAVIGWLAAGLGMGLAYPTLSVLVLELSPPTEQGANSSALQIAEALFSAVALAASGALFAALVGAGPVAYAVGFAVAVVPAALAVSIAGRAVGTRDPVR